MWKILKTRIKQGYRTVNYPKERLNLPERFRGKPVVNWDLACQEKAAASKAIDVLNVFSGEGLSAMDLGKCVFDPELPGACKQGMIQYSADYRMAFSKRDDLVLKNDETRLASDLNKKMKKLFGRSLRLRAVCAGGCNGCDAEIQVLNIAVFDLPRFGIQYAASPRHADGLIITGPVTKNMKEALLKTYEAVPDPKLVIVVGACAISGGPFTGSSEVCDGVEGLLPIDLYIPGCPPHPWAILDGMLRLLGRVEESKNKKTK